MNKEDCKYLVRNFIIGKRWVYAKPKSSELRIGMTDLQMKIGEDYDARILLDLPTEKDRYKIRRAFIKAVKPVLIFKKWKNGCRVLVQDKYGQKYLFTDDPVKYSKLAIAHGIPETIGTYRVQLRCSMPWLRPEHSCYFFDKPAARYRNDYRGKYMTLKEFKPRLDNRSPDEVDP